MFRSVYLRLLNVAPLQKNVVRDLREVQHKNFVISEALAQMEQKCASYLPLPRIPPQKVTVVGAASDIGRIVCLMLKQQNVVKILSMYDDRPELRLFGVANDLAHIDTSTAVEAFQGRPYLKLALWNTDVVLICGGHHVVPPYCNIHDKDLFFQNMQFVRTTCVACAHFCPHAIICIQTPPVDCNFALCKHTLELYHVYDPRRLLGVNAISAMRANQLYSAAINSDPANTYVPVVCGTGRCTRVPVFSNALQFGCVSQEKTECLTRLVREADEIICRVKCNNQQGFLSIGFATARFVLNIMRGLFEEESFLESALVQQANPEMCYDMSCCSTPVKVGKGGITQYLVPKLNPFEQDMVDRCKCDFADNFNLGKCYALGDEYELHPCKLCFLYPHPSLCKECPEGTPVQSFQKKVDPACKDIPRDPPKDR